MATSRFVCSPVDGAALPGEIKTRLENATKEWTEQNPPKRPAGTCNGFPGKESLSCAWCSRVDLSLGGLVGSQIPIGKHTYRCLFHSTCRLRPRKDAFPDAACDFCRHLDLGHVVQCVLPLIAAEKPLSSTQRLNAEANIATVRLTLSTNWYHNASPESQCPFCQFLAIIFSDEESLGDIRLTLTVCMPQDKQLVLNIEVRNKAGSKKSKMKQLGYELPTVASGPIQIARQLDAEVDWTLIKSWLSDTGGDQKQLPKGFRVIDVMMNCIFAPEHRVDYVTLSYVWGSLGSPGLVANKENIEMLATEGGLLHEDIPATIQDAMTVCRQLGQRYLWVDRLCILQDGDEETKLQMINNMDRIYGSAVFTIVASSSSSGDARSGLSGVSRPRHAYQNTLIWPGIELIESFPTLEDIVAETRWSTRGWTFQEAICSRNTLYFTDYGVFLSQDSGCVRSERQATSGMPKLTNGYFSSVTQYTSRSLTVSTDILRAFTGVLNRIAGEHHYFGLPLSMFTESLLWQPLDWDAESGRSVESRLPDEEQSKQTANQEVFPSWSWSSVLGGVTYGSVYVTYRFGRSFLSLLHGDTPFDSEHPTVQPVAACAYSPLAGPGGEEAPLVGMSLCSQRGHREQDLVTVAWDEGLFEKEFFDYDREGRRDIQHKHSPDPAFLQAFSSEDRAKAAPKAGQEGRILVRTQSTFLRLMQIVGADTRECIFILYTPEGQLAGVISVSRLAEKEILLANSSHDHGRLRFLALSIPSSIGTSSIRKTLQHLFELRANRTLQESEEATLSDSEKEFVYNEYNALKGPVRLQVMLITETAGVARRLGIGEVYLKRWIQANPQFSNIVLA